MAVAKGLFFLDGYFHVIDSGLSLILSLKSQPSLPSNLSINSSHRSLVGVIISFAILFNFLIHSLTYLLGISIKSTIKYMCFIYLFLVAPIYVLAAMATGRTLFQSLAFLI